MFTTGRMSPIRLLSALPFVIFSCPVLSDLVVDTGKFEISDCLLNPNITSWLVTGSCHFRFHLSLLKERPLTQKDCVWRRTYYNETVITPLPATITMSEVSVDGQRYINGTCSFSSSLSSHRFLGRSSFIVVIADVEHRLENDIAIEEPLPPIKDCPHNVTEGDFVTCHCRSNPAAPGRPPATVGWRDLPAGDPLVVSNIDTSHADVVYQCQLQWGDPEHRLTVSVNHTFHLDSQEKPSTVDYIRNILRNTVACLLVASACVIIVDPQLLGSQRNVKDILLRTAVLACLLLLLCYLPALLWVVLKFLLWTLWTIVYGVLCLPYWLICGVVWLVLSLYSMVVAVIVFIWQCLYYVFWLVAIPAAIAYGVSQREVFVPPRSSVQLPLKQDPRLDFCTEPPRYWKIFHQYLEKGIVIYQESSVPRRVELSPSDREYQAVAHLMYKTWKSSCIGMGKDARNLSHTNIQVLSIERIENLKVWDKYNHKRHKMEISLSNSLKMLANSTKPVATSRDNETLSGHLNNQVNEHYLFHGTKEETLFEITRDGLDNRYAGNGLLGRGLYFAESSTKSDQYTDDKRSRCGGSHVMLLVRVLLGNAFVSNNPHPPNYVRPPCSRCQQIRCQCPESAHYDSVIDDAGRLFREFVVYDSSQCYPEYVIRYQRTHGLSPAVASSQASNCCVS